MSNGSSPFPFPVAHFPFLLSSLSFWGVFPLKDRFFGDVGVREPLDLGLSLVFGRLSLVEGFFSFLEDLDEGFLSWESLDLEVTGEGLSLEGGVLGWLFPPTL